MKRLLIILGAALALSGCAGLDIGGLADPIVRVAETLDDDNTSTKGATTGMSSGDARDVLINRAYYGAIKSIHGADKKDAGSLLLVDIEPMDGQPIVIHAKRFKVYAPPPQAGGAAPLAIAPPAVKKSLIKEVSEEARGWFRDAIVPWKSIDEGAETQRLQIITSGQIRQTELGIMDSAVTGSQGIATHAITTFKPLVVHAPAAASAPAAETPTTPTE